MRMRSKNGFTLLEVLVATAIMGIAVAGLAPRLAMRAAAQPAQINYHRDQQPKKIDSCRGHAAVKFPCVYDRGERQENEAEYGDHQTTVECALQVGREEPHQHERDARKQQDKEEQEAGHSQSQSGQDEPAQSIVSDSRQEIRRPSTPLHRVRNSLILSFSEPHHSHG
jgi:prepilin-type N-terminal cleavage/methylation domain-containing protein